MASGSWTFTGSNSWVGGKIEWSSTANASANTSSVTVTLYGCRTDGGKSYNDVKSNFQITIDGTKTTRTSALTISGTSYVKIHSQTKTVSHNSDGKKSITISAGGEITETTYIMGTQTKTIALDNIVRTFTVAYNANGGSGAPSSQTKTYGTTLTLSTTKPTRSGYNFVGWGTSSDATSASYQPGGKYTANSAITLYAIWESVDRLTFSCTTPTITITSDNTGTVKTISNVTVPFTVNTNSSNSSSNFYYKISSIDGSVVSSMYGPFAASQSSTNASAKNITITGDMIKASLLHNRDEDEIPFVLSVYTTSTTTNPVVTTIRCPLSNFRIITMSTHLCSRTSDGGVTMKLTATFSPSYSALTASNAVLPTIKIDGGSSSISPSSTSKTISGKTVTYTMTFSSSAISSSASHSYIATITDGLFSASVHSQVAAVGSENILIYKTGNCKAVEFVETSSVFGFQKGGRVCANIYEKESATYIDPSTNSMVFSGEIIEL